MKMDKRFWTDNDTGLLIIRVAFAVLVLFHGWHKVRYGIDMPMARMESWGIPGFLMYFAYISEVVAPLLIFAGLFSRLSALTIFGTMIFVMYIEIRTGLSVDQFGAPNIEGQLFYFLLSAGLIFTGPGRYRLKNTGSKNWLLE
jgi:putative oxidoreductase|tara:strand:- start:38 stop:466 length:429 start_codon:yes stop_codon:yes gene_type:complete